jgi:hypothetical protein
MTPEYYSLIDAPAYVQLARVAVTLAAAVALWACVRAWRAKP